MNHSKSVQNCAAAVCTLFFFAKIREKKGLSKNRWGLGVPLRNPGVDYPGEEKQLQTYMGRHSGLLFFVFADYYAVRHQQKGKGSESSFPATSEPTTKTMVSVSHSQYKIVKHPNHPGDF